MDNRAETIQLLQDHAVTVPREAHNTLMFQLLIWARRTNKMAGFIHVPLLTSQAPRLETTPRMDDDSAASALAKIIRFSWDSMPKV